MCHFPWISFDELKKYVFTIFFLLFKGISEGLIGDKKSDIYTRNRSNDFYFKNKIIKDYMFSWKKNIILFGLRSENQSNIKNTTIFCAIWSSKSVFLHATDDFICDKTSRVWQNYSFFRNLRALNWLFWSSLSAVVKVATEKRPNR